jgi:hypothetical protein
MQNNERRRDARARISLPMAVVRRGGEIPVRMLDASFRGVFVAMESPPPVRELVRIRVELPSGPLVVHAVVVRIVEDALGRAGVGLRFFALGGQERLAWEAFVGSVVHAAQAA